MGLKERKEEKEFWEKREEKQRDIDQKKKRHHWGLDYLGLSEDTVTVTDLIIKLFIRVDFLILGFIKNLEMKTKVGNEYMKHSKTHVQISVVDMYIPSILNNHHLRILMDIYILKNV